MSDIYTSESDALRNVHILKIRLPREDYLELMAKFSNMLVQDQLDELIYLSDLNDSDREQIAGKPLNYIKVLERYTQIGENDFSFLQNKLSRSGKMRQVLNDFNKLALELYMRSTCNRASMVAYDSVVVEPGDDHENLEDEDPEPAETVEGREQSVNLNQVGMPVQVQQDDDSDTFEADIEETLLGSAVLGADVRYVGSSEVEDCAGPSEQVDTHDYENSGFFQRAANSSDKEDAEDHICGEEAASNDDTPPPIPEKKTLNAGGGEEEIYYTEIPDPEEERDAEYEAQEDSQVGDDDADDGDGNVAQACNIATTSHNKVEDSRGNSDQDEIKENHAEPKTNKKKEKTRGLKFTFRPFIRRGSSQN